MAVVFAIGALTILVQAVPQVAFPFNSQVPTVARVDTPYDFQFSASTFTPDATNFSYLLAGQPAWLSIDSGNGMLFGMPGQGDVGATTFTIIAADSTGTTPMECTLVVSDEPPPRLQGTIGSQLAANSNLSVQSPANVTLHPRTTFDFQFSQGSFIDIVARNLSYYATLVDHTPLPSWISFDSRSLSFSGMVPELSAFPQSFDVDFIASDVVGFAGASASFTIQVAQEKLVFAPQEQTLSVSAGTTIDFKALESQLLLDGAPMNAEQLHKATAILPPWLSFNPENLVLTGTPPVGAQDQDIVVTVTDNFGDTASATIQLMFQSQSLFTGVVGNLTAQAGQDFDYSVRSVLNGSGLIVTVQLGIAAAWLHFDPKSLNIEGIVPARTSAVAVKADIEVRSSTETAQQNQSFFINIEAEKANGPTSTLLASRASATNSSTASSTSVLAGAAPKGRHLSGGIVAAIVIACLVFAPLLIAAAMLCYRRRKRGYERTSASPSKNIISRPLVTTEISQVVTPRTQHYDNNLSVNELMQVNSESRAPQIALNLPPHSARGSRTTDRISRVSQVSSIGDGGELALQADINVPELGGIDRSHTPHDSFSVPTQMARLSSQLSQLSPRKRAMKRRRESERSQNSVGLGIDLLGPMPRHSSKRSDRYGKRTSSMGFSASHEPSSRTSLSTVETNVLADFPRPPESMQTLSRSVPTLSLTEAEKRRSIRLVARSDSIADKRSIEEKRRSFIRKRASTSLQSPLFAHGSRASSKIGANSVGDFASSVGSQRRSRRGRSGLTTYSESSSLEPPIRDSRRLSARLRASFAPNFPRAVTHSSFSGVEDRILEQSDSSWSTATSDSAGEEEFRAQLALPRHQRSWVVPGEASPTPPPRAASRLTSSQRHLSGETEKEAARQKQAEQLSGQGNTTQRSPSPLSTAVAVPLADRNSLFVSGRASQARRSKLSEPLTLVSNDSLSSTRRERPRLVHNNSGRPVSVEQVQRLSSLKAEREEEDAEAGGEQGEDAISGIDGSGMLGLHSNEAQGGTQRSTMSGRAFL